MQPQDTRSIIISRCFELLLEKGYDGVSISDIQNSTGFARGLLYHYFGSKEVLFLESIKFHFTQLFEIEKEKIEGYNVRQMITYLVAKYRKLTCETLRGVSIVNYDFLFYRAMQQSQEITKMFKRVRDDEIKAWVVALGNSLKNGEIKQGLDLEKLAKQFTYTTDGVWFVAVTPSETVDLTTELEAALNTLYSLIKTE